MKFAILEDDLIIFYRYYLVKWVRIVSVANEKISKDPRKTRNELSLDRKQELDFSRIFW
jgi:hypothetical protein